MTSYFKTCEIILQSHFFFYSTKESHIGLEQDE